MSLPTPHGDKLQALLLNSKLPSDDRLKIERAVAHYQAWIDALNRLPSGNDSVAEMVNLLSEYRLFLDLDVVFDSLDNFLYRQKGQLKLDNSVIEEFLPHLVTKVFPDLSTGFAIGPYPCFASLYFTSTIGTTVSAPGAQVRTKDQDFTISRRLYLKTTFQLDSDAKSDTLIANLGYFCAECKTNLDKTMFQEASATAHDLKTAVPGAKYLLLCEWLDMLPISTVGTDIDEVLILRKARRLGAQIRGEFATYGGRTVRRNDYEKYLGDNPFSPAVFERLISHVRVLLEDRDPNEGDVLKRGYF